MDTSIGERGDEASDEAETSLTTLGPCLLVEFPVSRFGEERTLIGTRPFSCPRSHSTPSASSHGVSKVSESPPPPPLLQMPTNPRDCGARSLTPAFVCCLAGLSGPQPPIGILFAALQL